MSNKDAWIQTFTGRQFYPLTPSPEQIVSDDFIHALSHICRFTGHCKKFYSVAEHSRRVADLFLSRRHTKWNKYWNIACAYVYKWTGGRIRRNLLKNISPSVLNYAKYGICHDISEAYLADIARPLKIQDEYAIYRQQEAQLQGMIYEMHGLHIVEPSFLHSADYTMCNTERKELMSAPPPVQERFWEQYPPLEEEQGLGWSPATARVMFWELYDQLFGKNINSGSQEMVMTVKWDDIKRPITDSELSRRLGEIAKALSDEDVTSAECAELIDELLGTGLVEDAFEHIEDLLDEDT